RSFSADIMLLPLLSVAVTRSLKRPATFAFLENVSEAASCNVCQVASELRRISNLYFVTSALPSGGVTLAFSEFTFNNVSVGFGNSKSTLIGSQLPLEQMPNGTA